MENYIPEFLKEKLVIEYDKDIANEILDGFTKNRKVTFRVNTLKSNKAKVKETLKNNNIEFEEVSWYEMLL